MSSRIKISATAIIGAVALAGAYVAADGADILPGFFTFDAPLPKVAAFPDTPQVDLAPSEVPLFAKATDFDANTYKSLTQNFVTDYRVDNAKVSFWVGDLQGVELASHDAESAYTAASTTKLLTSLAALHEFGPNARARTVVAWDDAQRKLFLIAGGDFLLGTGPDARRSIQGYAGLDTLATDTVVALSAKTPGNNPQTPESKKSATATPTETAPTGSATPAGKAPTGSLLQGKPYTLVVDTSWFGNEAVSSLWRDGDTRWVGPIQGLAIDRGIIDPNSTGGYYADSSQIVAQSFADSLTRIGGAAPGKIETGSSGLATGKLLDPLSPLPELATGSELSKGRVPVAYSQGAPLAQVERKLLKDSDNTLAEGWGRLVALHRGSKPTFENAGQAVMDSLRDLKLDLGQTELKGCSGLAYDTHIPSRVLADVVRLSQDPKHPEFHSIMANVPVAGVDGTLSNAYQGTMAAGLVRGKTGSLGITNSLAGTFVRDNQVFVYGLVISGYPENAGAPSVAAKQIFMNGLVGAKAEFSDTDPEKTSQPENPPAQPATPPAPAKPSQ